MRCRALWPLIAALWCVVVGDGSAVGQTWFGANAGGDGVTWQDAGNWDTGIVPELPGDQAFFDAGVGVPLDRIQLAGDVALERLEIINSGTGPWVLADDNPDNGQFILQFAGGGPAPGLMVGGTGGGHIIERSIDRVELATHVAFDFLDPTDMLTIDANFEGLGNGLMIRGAGGVAFTGDNFLVDVVENESQQSVFGNANTQSYIAFDFITLPGGFSEVNGFMNVGSAIASEGQLLVHRDTDIRAGGVLGGAGTIDLETDSTLVAQGNAGSFSGAANLHGTLSVGSAYAGNVVVFDGGGVGTTAVGYNPTLDPAVVVDPSVTTPGDVNLSIDVLGFAGAINPNFSNGRANAYRVGSATSGSITGPLAPFDDLVNQPVYLLGGNDGSLDISVPLPDSPASGNSTAVHVDAGRIRLSAGNSFSGPVAVEGGQLILANANAVAGAASLTATSPAAQAGTLQFDGGNFDHGTVVFDPMLVGGYTGPPLVIDGGALGFTLPTNVDLGLSLGGGQTGPTLFDIGNFDRGGVFTPASLLGLGGDSFLTLAGPTGFVDDARSPSGNPVVLFTSGLTRVTLTQPNAHTGGTAVLGESGLIVQDLAALGSGPVNIADGARLRFETSGTVVNNFDMHSTGYAAASGIEVETGHSVQLAGNISTDHAPGATFRKTGDGMLAIAPAVPISAINGENLWGLRLVAGTTLLGQLPELEAAIPGTSQGPVIVEEFSTPRLEVAPHASANATDPNLAGFGRLAVEQGSSAEFVVDDQLLIGGLLQGNVLGGHLIKLGGGPMFLGGDSSGGDAIGYTPAERGRLDIRSGDVIIGGVPFTDDGANAFPTGANVNIEDGANLIVAHLDTPATIHTLTINPLTFGAGAAANLFHEGLAPLVVERLVQEDRLLAGGQGVISYQPVVGPTFSGASSPTIQVGAGSTFEVDGSQVAAGEALVDPNTGVGAGVSTLRGPQGPGEFHVVAGDVTIAGLGGSGKTVVDAGARLYVDASPVNQEDLTINGQFEMPGIGIFLGRLAGNGVGQGIFGTAGTVAPGDGGVGTLVLNGGAGAGTGTIFEFELGGTNQGVDYDLLQLNLTSQMLLQGVLDVQLVGGFTPSLGQVFTVIEAPGGFDMGLPFPPLPGSDLENETALALSGGLVLRAQINPTDVDLVTTFAADFDADFDVDQDDLAVWQSAAGATGPLFGYLAGRGDADADGDSDGADFLVWQRQVGSHFPLQPVVTAVPEPASGWLAFGLVVLAGFVRGRQTRLETNDSTYN